MDLKSNALAIYSDLIRYWLHQEPAEDFEKFTEQSARALNLEERFFEAQAASFAKILGKILSG